MKYTKFAILIVAMLCFFNSNLYAQLSYAEGGPAVEDPGAGLSPDLRRYVDAQNGDDSNDGKSPATAWQTLSKVMQEKGNLGPGIHILFKRGQTWSGSLKFGNHPGGEGGRRIVIGAYGNLENKRPVINGVIEISNYFMARDLECAKMSIANAHHAIIYNNIVHGGESNGIRVIGESHHTAVVGNLVYDVRLNDGIVLHDINWETPIKRLKSSHWILDNVVIGNDGVEDGIDCAMGDYSIAGATPEGDVKVIANRIQMTALPGLSQKTGSGQIMINIGHEGHYFWVIGNTVSGSAHYGVQLGETKTDFQVRGNIIFKGSNSELCMLKSPHIHFEHNTILQYKNGVTPVFLNSDSSLFLNNLILRTTGGNWAKITSSNVTAMDYNWWGYSENPLINSTSLISWQSSTGFDTHSGVGDVPGVTPPPDEQFNNDPRNWDDPAFLSHFIPSTEFSGCSGYMTPGAFDCSGKRLGLIIQPFEGSGLENGGLGWEGPPLVQQRLEELGISFGNPRLARKPNPPDRAENVSIHTNLSWVAGEGAIGHDVYFGLKPDSLDYKGNQTTTTFTLDSLAYETTYFWRIDEITEDSTFTGNVWRFTTEEEPTPPTLAGNPNPADSAVNVRTTVMLIWESGRRARSHDVYFGTENPPPFIQNQKSNLYNPGLLKLNTRYYWRIDEKNEYGTTEGVVWFFDTQSELDLPLGWTSTDIGDVGLPGESKFTDGTFTVTASGADIGGNADELHYVYFSLFGDGNIVARVVSLENTDSGAKAGVMIRENLTSSSACAGTFISAEKGTQFQQRNISGGKMESFSGSSAQAPYWVKIMRIGGNNFVGYESADGFNWKVITAEQINMPANVYIGLAVTSHNNGALCTATFDKVRLNDQIVQVEQISSFLTIPKEFAVYNYPNPFNATTKIRFNLPEAGLVTVEVFSILGKEVVELVNEYKAAGSYEVIWKSRNANGKHVASGVYFYQVKFKQQMKMGKMILMQ